jgi:hypothetical protein
MFLFIPSAAFADAIDGSWCNSAGAHISIEGPKISLSPKTTIEGQYARHEFLYTVPAGEDHAGDVIYMRLRGEEDMTSFTVKDGKGVDPVDWKRCAVTS